MVVVRKKLEKDPIHRLMYSHVVEAQDPLEALKIAVAKCLRISRLNISVIDELFEFKRLEPSIFKVISKKWNTTILARVTETEQHIEGAETLPWGIRQIVLRTLGVKEGEYVVTFYPHTLTKSRLKTSQSVLSK